MIAPSPAVLGLTLSRQPKIRMGAIPIASRAKSCVSVRKQNRTMQALIEANTKAIATATANFEGLGIVVLNAQKAAVTVNAVADAGQPTKIRNSAPADTAIPIQMAFWSAKKNSLRFGNRTSPAGFNPSRKDNNPSSSCPTDST